VRLENREQGADRANSHTALLATRSLVLMGGSFSMYRQNLSDCRGMYQQQEKFPPCQ